MPGSFTKHTSSYRDPSGFIFLHDNIFYRQVNKVFGADFDLFTASGCYDRLVEKTWLLPHTVINENLTGQPQWHSTLRPEKLDFISYPYEWSFGMLKDAALLTLDILRESINSGMILKDASPYNIQWHKGRLVFIDSLSFEKYDESEPWIAYRQFCEHFLSPLLLAHFAALPLQSLLLAYPNGIPLAFTSKMLPWHSRFSIDTYLHIHLHAKYAAKTSASAGSKQTAFSKKKLLTLVTSMQSLVQKLELKPARSTWSDYYEEASQRKDYLQQKTIIIQQWLHKVGPITTAADLGANTGEFSKLAASRGIFTIAADFDAYCIQALYTELKNGSSGNILPLVMDLAQPSPAIGVNNEERQSFIDRVNVDLVMALALIHHLAIGKNIPLDMLADFFSRLSKFLIIEFVPREDSMLQKMLAQKEDVYIDYNEENFRQSFSCYFDIMDRLSIEGSGRTLYLMKKK